MYHLVPFDLTQSLNVGVDIQKVLNSKRVGAFSQFS